MGDEENGLPKKAVVKKEIATVTTWAFGGGKGGIMTFHVTAGTIGHGHWVEPPPPGTVIEAAPAGTSPPPASSATSSYYAWCPRTDHTIGADGVASDGTWSAPTRDDCLQAAGDQSGHPDGEAVVMAFLGGSYHGPFSC